MAKILIDGEIAAAVSPLGVMLYDLVTHGTEPLEFQRTYMIADGPNKPERTIVWRAVRDGRVLEFLDRGAEDKFDRFCTNVLGAFMYGDIPRTQELTLYRDTARPVDARSSDFRPEQSAQLIHRVDDVIGAFEARKGSRYQGEFAGFAIEEGRISDNLLDGYVSRLLNAFLDRRVP